MDASLAPLSPQLTATSSPGAGSDRASSAGRPRRPAYDMNGRRVRPDAGHYRAPLEVEPSHVSLFANTDSAVLRARAPDTPSVASVRDSRVPFPTTPGRSKLSPGRTTPPLNQRYASWHSSVAGLFAGAVTEHADAFAEACVGLVTAAAGEAGAARSALEEKLRGVGAVGVPIVSGQEAVSPPAALAMAKAALEEADAALEWLAPTTTGTHSTAPGQPSSPATPRGRFVGRPRARTPTPSGTAVAHAPEAPALKAAVKEAVGALPVKAHLGPSALPAAVVAGCERWAAAVAVREGHWRAVAAEQLRAAGEARQEARASQHSVSDGAAALSRRRAEAAALQQRCEALSRQLERSEAVVVAGAADAERLGAELAARDAQLRESAGRLVEAEAAVDHLRVELRKAQREARGEAAERQRCEDEAGTLQAALSKAQEALATAERRLELCDVEAAEAAVEHRQLTAEVEALRALPPPEPPAQPDELARAGRALAVLEAADTDVRGVVAGAHAAHCAFARAAWEWGEATRRSAGAEALELIGAARAEVLSMEQDVGAAQVALAAEERRAAEADARCADLERSLAQATAAPPPLPPPPQCDASSQAGAGGERAAHLEKDNARLVAVVQQLSRELVAAVGQAPRSRTASTGPAATAPSTKDIPPSALAAPHPTTAAGPVGAAEAHSALEALSLATPPLSQNPSPHPPRARAPLAPEVGAARVFVME